MDFFVKLLMLPFQALAAIFVPNPLFAAVPAIGFVLLFVATLSKPSGPKKYAALAASLLWFLYLAYENDLKHSCPGECNIRLDLFFIYSILMVASGAGIVGALERPDPPSSREK